jgi:hypothetical protein
MIIRIAILGCTLILAASVVVPWQSAEVAASVAHAEMGPKRPADEGQRQPRPRPRPARDFG